MHFQDKVVYQIYPKSFQDSNGDGWGDIPGVIQRLDYLKDLGIDYIWFNPMTVSPQKDNGYDVADYRKIDSRYGTMEDFELLIQQAKQRNINIMLDMVFNHTSTEHAWFQKALQNDAEYKDYYIWRKGKGNGQPPNNWQSKFGGSAWEYVEKFDEWYLHLFDVSQADLNWENPRVRKECAEIVNFWRKKGVHGFRFDVVNLISKAGYEDDPNMYDGRQFYTDGPRVHEFLKELSANSFGQDEYAMTVGEMSSTTLANCVKYSGEETDELSMVFTFHHLKVDYRNQMKWQLQDFDFIALKKLLNTWQLGMQEAGAWNALFWNNHDQPRVLSRFGNDQEYRLESAKMLATVIHMMRGVPYIYMGEEIGETNAYFDDIDQYADVESKNIFEILKQEGKTATEIYRILQARSRDNARTPMQWDASENAGFTSGIPWLQLCSNYKEINVENDRKNPNSIFAYYQKLIRLRKEYPLIQLGEFVPLSEDHPEVYAYQRKYQDEELMVISHFYGGQSEMTIEDPSSYQILLSNYPSVQLQDTLCLHPYESIVLYRKHQ